NPIITAGYYERHSHIHVVLRERNVLPLIIDDPRLMLPQPIKRLIRRRLELLPDLVIRAPINGDRPQLTPPTHFAGNDLSLRILEHDLPVIEANDRAH